MIPLEDTSSVPDATVIDGHFFTSRYGKHLRCTAVGEFDGWHSNARRDAERDLRANVARLYPHLAEAANSAQVQCGLRPMSADGGLLCGRVGHGNLFLNTSHGQHGWKLALGSAELVARAVAGEAQGPEIDDSLFTTKGRVKYEPVFTKLASLLHLWAI